MKVVRFIKGGRVKCPYSVSTQLHFFVIMSFSEFASLSTLDLAIAEVKGLVKVTRLDTVKPRSSDLILTQTKGNRCRTNRSSGTNFVRQV